MDDDGRREEVPHGKFRGREGVHVRNHNGDH